MALILFCLFIAIYFDIVLFKRQDTELFKKVFELSVGKAALSLLLILATLLLSENWLEDLPSLVLILVLVLVYGLVLLPSLHQ